MRIVRLQKNIAMTNYPAGNKFRHGNTPGNIKYRTNPTLPMWYRYLCHNKI